MKRILRKVDSLIKIYLLRDKFSLSAKKWFKDDGDNTLRLDYNLTKDSIVFDVGGFEGKFSEDIYNKYQSNIFIFEPVASFYSQIEYRFLNNDKIHKYNFGLSDINRTINISLSNDASSIYGKSSDYLEEIELKSIVEFINNNNIKKIDLMKINIEGGEFDLLPSLIEQEIIKNIDNIQIQFHTFVDNAEFKRDNIRKELSKTHKLTYDYYFIWENWKRK